MNRQIVNFYGLFFSFIFILASCGGQTDVVESGTYSGVIQKVNADEVEIYVKTSDDKVLELYFTEETSLVRNGESVDFSILTENMNVTVEVEKKGKKLVPLSVTVND